MHKGPVSPHPRQHCYTIDFELECWGRKSPTGRDAAEDQVVPRGGRPEGGDREVMWIWFLPHSSGGLKVPKNNNNNKKKQSWDPGWGTVVSRGGTRVGMWIVEMARPKLSLTTGFNVLLNILPDALQNHALLVIHPVLWLRKLGLRNEMPCSSTHTENEDQLGYELERWVWVCLEGFSE